MTSPENEQFASLGFEERIGTPPDSPLDIAFEIISTNDRSFHGCEFRATSSYLVVNPAFLLMKQMSPSNQDPASCEAVLGILSSYIHNRHANGLTTTSHPHPNIGKISIDQAKELGYWTSDYTEALSTVQGVVGQFTATINDYSDYFPGSAYEANANEWQELGANVVEHLNDGVSYL